MSKGLDIFLVFNSEAHFSEVDEVEYVKDEKILLLD